jgi:hypothetical protein
MCLLCGTNWVFISQKTTFFRVTAVKTSNLTSWLHLQQFLCPCLLLPTCQFKFYTLKIEAILAVTSIYVYKGNAYSRLVSSRPPTAAARVRAQVMSCGICGGQNTQGQIFSEYCGFPCHSFHRLVHIIRDGLLNAETSTDRVYMTYDLSSIYHKARPFVEIHI